MDFSMTDFASDIQIFGNGDRLREDFIPDFFLEIYVFFTQPSFPPKIFPKTMSVL